MNPLLRPILEQAARRRKTPLWLVGGPVRDELLRRPCQDWDFVCQGAKGLARDTAKRLKAKFIVLDEQYKIYRVILPSSGLRPPSPSIGGRKDNSNPRPIEGEGPRRGGEGPITLDFAELQGRSIEEDLRRRDFTINAMARSFPDGPVLDPCGGRRDLQRRVIRAVSEKSFRDDPLRLVRTFRFAAQFQFRLDAQTSRWIRKHRAGLSQVAMERVREELLRLWKQPRSTAALRLMDRLGLLVEIFPEIEACRRTAVRYYGTGGVLRHSFETVENLEWILQEIERRSGGAEEGKKLRILHPLARSFAHPLTSYLHEPIGGYPRLAWLKLAAFLHDVGKPATAQVIKGRLRFFEHEHAGAALAMRVGQRLRCSRQEVQLTGLWVRNHMRPGNLAAAERITDKALSRFFRDLGEEGVGMVLVSLADHYTYLARSRWGRGTDPVEKISRRLLSSYYEERAKILPARIVNGHDLMRQLKLKPGPRIGQLLEKIQDAQAEGKVTTKEEAIRFARKVVR